MKVVIISCFSDKNAYNRGNFIYSYFKRRNHDCYVIYSEFDHKKKIYNRVNDDRWIPIRTIKYKKNLSIKRMISHFLFGMKTASIIKELKPDLIYVAVPPNSAAFFASKIAKKLNSRLIVDVVDLWPESLVIPQRIKWLATPMLKIWKNLRESPLKNANVVMLECNLYKEYLPKNKFIDEKTCTVYLSKLDQFNEINELTSYCNDVLNICYIGSINHIVDFDFLLKFLFEMKKNKPVKLHIIGLGEKKEWLISKLNELEIPYIDYGEIYDESEKNKIMLGCDFGFNIYKNQTIIGLSYKSVDYFSAGLPLINSIKGDTWKLVEQYNAGINCCSNDHLYAVKKISNLSKDEIVNMKKNAFKVYVNNFSYKVVQKKLDSVIKMAIGDEYN